MIDHNSAELKKQTNDNPQTADGYTATLSSTGKEGESKDIVLGWSVNSANFHRRKRQFSVRE
jgi:hypothetical protein